MYLRIARLQYRVFVGWWRGDVEQVLRDCDFTAGGDGDRRVLHQVCSDHRERGHAQTIGRAAMEDQQPAAPAAPHPRSLRTATGSGVHHLPATRHTRVPVVLGVQRAVHALVGAIAACSTITAHQTWKLSDCGLSQQHITPTVPVAFVALCGPSIQSSPSFGTNATSAAVDGPGHTSHNTKHTNDTSRTHQRHINDTSTTHQRHINDTLNGIPTAY